MKGFYVLIQIHRSNSYVLKIRMNQIYRSILQIRYFNNIEYIYLEILKLINLQVTIQQIHPHF
jgi:hypothetical protein